MTVRYFGVGCFNFRIKRKPPYTTTPDLQCKVIEEALKSINSLSRIDINSFDLGDEEIVIEEDEPLMQDGGIRPALAMGYIKFLLYIPYRVQSELAYGGNPQTGSEYFRIAINYNFNGPVAYIEPVDAKDGCSPSDAVHVVNNYLEKQFAGNSDVLFEFMGPSPFHAEFEVHERGQDGEIECQTEIRRGYDLYRISIGAPLSEEDTLSSVYSALDPELDEFYHQNRFRVHQMHQWQEVQEQWQALQKLVRGPYSFYNIARKISIHATSRDLIDNAFSFIAEQSIIKQFSDHSYRSTYEKGLPTFMEHRVKEMANEACREYPTQSLAAWAAHVHDSSFKFAELFTLFGSALLGGVVGALVTAFLTAAPAASDNKAGNPTIGVSENKR